MKPHWVAMLVLATGCSRSYQDQALGIRYEPPTGARLEAADSGPSYGRIATRFERSLSSLTLMKQ